MATLASTALTAKLAALWMLDEGTGETAADLSGNGNTATIVGTANWQTLGGRPALLLNGSSQYLTVADDATLDFNAMSAVTVIAIVQPVALDADAVVLSKWDDTSTRRPIMLQVTGDSGAYHWAVNNYDIILESGETPANDTRIVLAGTWESSSGTMRLYSDGVADATPDDAETTLDPNDDDALTIGARNKDGTVDSFWDGYIESVAIFDEELSAGEILSLGTDFSIMLEGGFQAAWAIHANKII